MALKRAHPTVGKFLLTINTTKVPMLWHSERRLSRQRRPDRIKHNVSLSRHQSYHLSPVDWREKVLYFPLVDCFIDGLECKMLLLDRSNLAAAPPGPRSMAKPGPGAKWAESGASWWQGGTTRVGRQVKAWLSREPRVLHPCWQRISG
jgi:hypothetical protein